MPGRRWSEGLHQSEAKEGVRVPETITYATITIQNYFRMYEKLAGMTGTALTEAEEFSKIYKLDVLPIPTNPGVQRHRAERFAGGGDGQGRRRLPIHLLRPAKRPSRKPVFFKRRLPGCTPRTERRAAGHHPGDPALSHFGRPQLTAPPRYTLSGSIGWAGTAALAHLLGCEAY